MRTRNRAAGLAVMGVLALATSLSAESFDVLFRVSGVKGTCLVRKPGATNVFEPVIKGKAYPFGTTVRTGKDGEALILLSPDDYLRMTSRTELSVFDPEGSSPNSNRLVRVAEGKVEISVRDGLAEKALVVESSVAACDSFVGRSSMELSKVKKPAKGQLGLLLLVRTDNGTVRVTGPQFSVPKMKSGSAVRIESSADLSVTRITNEANDYLVDIDKDADAPVPLETSTHSTVRICREHAAVGGKLVVSVLETAPDGKGKGNFAFVVGEPVLNGISTNSLPALVEGGSTSTVTTATAPSATTVTSTNAAPKKEESLFQ